MQPVGLSPLLQRLPRVGFEPSQPKPHKLESQARQNQRSVVGLWPRGLESDPSQMGRLRFARMWPRGFESDRGDGSGL